MILGHFTPIKLIFDEILPQIALSESFLIPKILLIQLYNKSETKQVNCELCRKNKVQARSI